MSSSKTKIKLWVWIDPTNRCNLSCSLCYTKKSHGNKDLTSENLYTILKKLKNCSFIDLQVLHLNWRGEPLMNRDFPELLGVVGDLCESIPMHWHTNGALMSVKRAQEITEKSKPHKIYFSIDGGSNISHDKNRGKGTFEKAIQGLKNMLKANKKEKKLKIGIYQLDLKEKIENYDPEFLDLCKEVDEWVRVNPLLPNGDEKLFGQFTNLEGGMLNSYDFEQMDSRYLVPEGPCFWAGNAMCIDPLGNVSVCLLSHFKEGIVGNIIDEEVLDILERAKNFRKNIETNGRSSLLHCSGCLKPCGNVHNEATIPPQVNIDSLKESFCNEKEANAHISL